jgi:hypothetical protein
MTKRKRCRISIGDGALLGMDLKYDLTTSKKNMRGSWAGEKFKIERIYIKWVPSVALQLIELKD